MKKVHLLLIVGALVLSVLGGVVACRSKAALPLSAKARFRVATTTSLYDTGLWGYLEPKFEERYNVEMDIIYAGTGKALEYARRGDVDAIAVHSKKQEENFIAEGYGLERHPFAYNYFLIVGPESDPAGIRGMSPESAFERLMARGRSDPAKVKFVSRGDSSGTHSREKALWEAAGFQYDDVRASGSWYVEAGAGMGPTLVMANEMAAYTLTDIGTYLAHKGDLALSPLVDKGDMLLNVYSVIAVNPAKNPKTNITMANNLIQFLKSQEVQELIGSYGVKEYGRRLFTPCAEAEP